MSGVLRDGLSASSIAPQDEREGVSRRALLGAAVAIPLLPLDGGGRVGVAVGSGEEFAAPHSTSDLTPTLPSPIEGEGAWVSVLRAFRAAEAEIRAFERATARGSAEEEEIWLPVYEARLDAFGAAVRGVMLAGAPDFAAFAAKLELFFEHELEPNSVEEDILGAIRADVLRLAGLA